MSAGRFLANQRVNRTATGPNRQGGRIVSWSVTQPSQQDPRKEKLIRRVEALKTPETDALVVTMCAGLEVLQTILGDRAPYKMAATLNEVYGSLDANNLEATKAVKVCNGSYTEPTFIMLGLSNLLDRLRGNCMKASGEGRMQVEAAIKAAPLLKIRLAVYPVLKVDVLKWVGEQEPSGHDPKVFVATAATSNNSGPVRGVDTAPRPSLPVRRIALPR